MGTVALPMHMASARATICHGSGVRVKVRSYRTLDTTDPAKTGIKTTAYFANCPVCQTEYMCNSFRMEQP